MANNWVKSRISKAKINLKDLYKEKIMANNWAKSRISKAKIL